MTTSPSHTQLPPGGDDFDVSNPPPGAASPAAGVVTMSSQDFQILMQQVVSATNAANLAAQSIAARDTSSGALGSSDMARIIPKPDAFRPATRGQGWNGAPVRAMPTIAAIIYNWLEVEPAWHETSNQVCV